MKILGIDPGTSLIGWGIIETEPKITAIDYGCITNTSDSSVENRLKNIFEQINLIIEKNHPDAISIEVLYFANNAKTVITVGQARGVLILSAVLSNIQNYSYTPLQVKLAICGNGRAEKKQIQIMVTKILRLDKIPKPDDTADALAIALTHAFSYKMKKYL
jgi:crossover junction endodeoxyribonuclease RuvC